MLVPSKQSYVISRITCEHTIRDRGNPRLWPWSLWRCRPWARFKVKFCLLTVLLFGVDKPAPSLNERFFPLLIVRFPEVFLATLKRNTWRRADFFFCHGALVSVLTSDRESSHSSAASSRPSTAVPSGSRKRPVSPHGGSPAHTRSGGDSGEVELHVLGCLLTY